MRKQSTRRKCTRLRWTLRPQSLTRRRGYACEEAGMTEGRPVRHYIKREAAQARAYSQAVITKDGKTVWLAGQIGAADASGRSLAGDFDNQVARHFRGSAEPWRRPAALW